MTRKMVWQWLCRLRSSLWLRRLERILSLNEAAACAQCEVEKAVARGMARRDEARCGRCGCDEATVLRREMHERSESVARPTVWDAVMNAADAGNKTKAWVDEQ
jgi:hypothetical protein